MVCLCVWGEGLVIQGKPNALVLSRLLPGQAGDRGCWSTLGLSVPETCLAWWVMRWTSREDLFPETVRLTGEDPSLPACVK